MKRLPLLLLATLWLGSALAANPDPWAPNAGPLRVEGPPEMAGVLQRWIAGFARQEPHIAVQVQLRGTDVGLGALTTGRADIALAGRDAAPQEVKGFEWIYRYRPTVVDVMTGSLDHPGHAPALAILVHRDNPLSAVTVAQLERVFNADRQGGHPAPWETWGELGLAGDWAKRPLHLYLPDTESGTGVFFRNKILAGSRTLPWDRLTEVSEGMGPGDERHSAGRRLALAVSRDVKAMAVAPLTAPLPAGVKLLPLAAGGEALAPSADNLIARRYALGRVVHAYVNAAPAQPVDPAHAHPLDPRVAQFLRYVLSPEGQHEVDVDGGFLPLLAEDAVAQSHLLP
jgi:phosphate transport system substrate-binding protein